LNRFFRLQTYIYLTNLAITDILTLLVGKEQKKSPGTLN
jgi:hypothetical protein